MEIGLKLLPLLFSQKEKPRKHNLKLKILRGCRPKINFDLKPEELEAYLDEYVIRQDEAKAVLATKICTHFNRIKYWEQQERARVRRVRRSGGDDQK